MFQEERHFLLRAVPVKKIWGSLNFVGLVGGWLFFSPVGGCLLRKCNLVGGCPSQKYSSVGILVQMGSCGLFEFKYKEE